MSFFISIDKALFRFINSQTANPFFDAVMPWIRNPPIWAPLYLFLILFILINFPKKGYGLLLMAIATVALTDSISSHVLKVQVGRLRPCNDPSIAATARLLLDYRPQNGSFTSSHAANHFGLVFFLFFTLKKLWGKWLLPLFAWAFLICYAQVYVGVHFPGDVVGGAVLGALIAWLTSKLFHKIWGEAA